jgi:hypothetical protein
LVRCLRKQQPTIFQYHPEFIVVFDQSGASRLSLADLLPKDPASNIWALVDTSASVQKPAPMLVQDGSPYFIVIALSPRAARWADMEHYMSPLKLWFMEPFTLAELIQA